MVQKFRPTVMEGQPVMVPDQTLGLWVQFSDYQTDLANEAQSNQQKFQKAEGNFYDELDRLEETNKKLHGQLNKITAAIHSSDTTMEDLLELTGGGSE